MTFEPVNLYGLDQQKRMCVLQHNHETESEQRKFDTSIVGQTLAHRTEVKQST
jgi:hypothetical protein